MTFKAEDIWSLHLNQVLNDSHSEIRHYLATNAPVADRHFFGPDRLLDIVAVLSRASDRALPVELVACAINHAGKANIAAQLRSYRREKHVGGSWKHCSVAVAVLVFATLLYWLYMRNHQLSDRLCGADAGVLVLFVKQCPITMFELVEANCPALVDSILSQVR
jgi:hypothetical protein